MGTHPVPQHIVTVLIQQVWLAVARHASHATRLQHRCIQQAGQMGLWQITVAMLRQTVLHPALQVLVTALPQQA
jgi:hypothetical protein